MTLLLSVLFGPSAARAQSLESVLSPGPLIKGHVKAEHECNQCHVRFNPKGQDALCQECHKEVRVDVQQRTGHHGRMKPQACRSCHTDHRGRDAKVAEFDRKTFDHKQTDFALREKHVEVECVKCHLAGKRWAEAPLDCNSCHKKDDVHKGGLGLKCGDCHNERKWKEVDFDHGKKTRFALAGKHADVKCDDCHAKGRYKDTPRTCIACHKKDDEHKGQYGEKCESCHGVKTWKPSTFNHDVDTKYPLKGKHRSTKCADCHSTGPIYRNKLGTECIDCHRKDDKHKETLGKDCASCHGERSWKEPPKFDHEQTRFPLLGKHQKTECKDCHKDALYRQTPGKCIDCHRKDDKHVGTLGVACNDCHVERDWKTTVGRFDHQRTKFPLRNAHAAPKVKCADCHRDFKSYRNTALDCLSCHKKDDKHEGSLGKQCEQCHSDTNWRVAGFDHARSRFPLVGKHVNAKCNECHKTQRFKEAPRDCWSCHKKDDVHKLAYGTACEDCHNARSWPLWAFDHDRRTEWKLLGAHRKTRCDQCHTKPAPAGKRAAALERECVACPRRDDVHDGGFGNRCEQCHLSDNWKQLRPRAH
jgi:hypothetical protein